MRRWLWIALGVALGAAALYVWKGQWPRSLRELAAYRESLEGTAARPPEPLIGNVYGRRLHSLAGTWNAIVDPNRTHDRAP